jgi:DNA mismatch repair ATPase MutS
MCGVPYHASRSYIARLLKYGKKVAICEQISEPVKGKGLVERQVTEVITPGTAVDEDYLDKGSANYLSALASREGFLSFAYIDLSTGEFRATSFPLEGGGERLGSELERLQSILSRYIPLEEKRKARRYYAEYWNRFGFLFSNPEDLTIISGQVKTISAAGLSFTPDNPAQMKNIRLNMELSECSLRVGDSILSPICILVRTGPVVSLHFKYLPEDEWTILEKYLEKLPLLRLKRKEIEAQEVVRELSPLE